MWDDTTQGVPDFDLTWRSTSRDAGNMDDTMHGVPDFDQSWGSTSRDTRNIENELYNDIDAILDSALSVKAVFETTSDEENAPEDDVVAEDFSLIGMGDALTSTFNRIDDGILETLEKDFITDDQAFKMKHKFPNAFADDDTAASTFDSHFVKTKPINEAFFDVSNHIESSFRPTTKSFAKLDESFTRNTGYNHSAGFKDYDKLAKRKRKPDFLFYGLVPKTIFRDTTSTLEPTQRLETDMRKLILEFKEFLAHPDNIPWQLNSDYAADTSVKDDEWDVKHLKEITDLRNLSLQNQPQCQNDDDLQFLFQGFAMKLKLDPEGMYSQLKNDYDGGISFLNGAAPLDPNKLNPYSSNVLTEKYSTPCNIPREPCTATFPLHPGRKPLSPKFIAAPETREVKTGLPFELKPSCLPYECPRVVQEYTNHLIIRVALNRYIFNNDDSFAHLILFKLLDAQPDVFYAQEAFRIFVCPARSMTHKEIQTLVRIANDYQRFDSFLHCLLAMDYFREKNFIGMEEELYNWCYSQRYASMEKFYHPFPETSESEKSTYKDNKGNLAAGARKCVVLTCCLYVLTLNYQKALQMIKPLSKYDYEALEEEDLLHWTIALDAQSQICQVNPYAQEARTFFEKTSDFFCMSSCETMDNLDRFADLFKTRLENVKDGDSAIPEDVKELTFRYLMMQYIYLQHHSLSTNERHSKGIYEIFDLLCSVPFYDGKTRRLERLAKTLMRSYHLAIGKNGYGPQLSLAPEPQLIRDSHEGYTVEGTIVESVLNAYELAYNGKFDDALNIISKLEIAYMDTVIGYHNITIAKSCIEFDKSFFTKTRIHSEKKLSALYEACPLEALFRDIPYQIIHGEVNPTMIRQLLQIIGHSKSKAILPTTQLRCYIALAQIFVELEKYRDAIEELTKAMELATKLDLSLFVSMIHRRLAIVYFCMNVLPEAYKALEKCKAVQLNVNIPPLEAGMIYFTKFIIHRKGNQSGNVKGVQIIPNYALIEYLMNAAKLLKPFTLVYKWLLVEEFDFVVSLLNRADSEPNKGLSVEREKTLLLHHQEAFKERFSQQFDLKDFCLELSNSDLTKMAAEYKRKCSLPFYSI